MLQTLHSFESELRRERDAASKSTGSNELELAKHRIEELTRENRQLTKAVEEADRRTAMTKSSLTATEESLHRLLEAVKTGKTVAVAANGATAIGTGASCGPTGSGSAGTTAVGAVSASERAASGSTAPMIRLDHIEADRAEIERLRSQLNEACQRGSEAERNLIGQDFEHDRLKEVRWRKLILDKYRLSILFEL
ncbi:unnamed protein product [Protopolystoma xenopodis]|uniref:Uncharacterized protein n=1 Tax=Protopolystoma xenopodis TaxID=117903 RepID=A0A3S5A9G5_9PLAT|nr:unnamed protein product [Protopolystoma xenopodis]